MLYINIIIIFLLLSLYILSLRYTDQIFINIDKKKHKLYFLYPMVGFFLTKTGLEKRLLNKADISEKIRALYISDHHEVQIRFYWYQKTALFLFVILSFSSLSLITSIQAVLNKSNAYDINLTRPEEGEGDSLVTFLFRMENIKDKDDIYEDEIVIQNKERIYTENEWREVLDKAIPYLESTMLGENKTLDHVNRDLNLIKNIPGTGIAVEWIPKDYRIILSSGELSNDDMVSDSTDTLITAVLKYKDKRVEHTIPLTIWPVELNAQELLYRRLQKVLSINEKETGMAKEWSLPGQIDDYFLTWEKPENNPAIKVFILGLFGSVFIWLYRERELDSKLKKRKNQMLLDYPEIINKFNLLVNAGMTIKQAWSKIAEDYKAKNCEDNGYKRYAYEEMLVTLNELKLGIPEVNAYEQFGIRAGLMPFMKFSSMLIQNLKKGNRNMVDMLKQEAMEAFQERKETTKRLGEEASTKLLGPMMIMLFIVLIIIMIPAFVSLRM